MNPSHITRIARIFKCTEQQVRDQLKRNRAQLDGMADQSRDTGRNVNGYTEQQLRDMRRKLE